MFGFVDLVEKRTRRIGGYRLSNFVKQWFRPIVTIFFG
jgi:hypothetical protein